MVEVKRKDRKNLVLLQFHLFCSDKNELFVSRLSHGSFGFLPNKIKAYSMTEFLTFVTNDLLQKFFVQRMCPVQCGLLVECLTSVPISQYLWWHCGHCQEVKRSLHIETSSPFVIYLPLEDIPDRVGFAITKYWRIYLWKKTPQCFGARSICLVQWVFTVSIDKAYVANMIKIKGF